MAPPSTSTEESLASKTRRSIALSWCHTYATGYVVHFNIAHHVYHVARHNSFVALRPMSRHKMARGSSSMTNSVMPASPPSIDELLSLRRRTSGLKGALTSCMVTCVEYSCPQPMGRRYFLLLVDDCTHYMW